MNLKLKALLIGATLILSGQVFAMQITNQGIQVEAFPNLRIKGALATPDGMFFFGSARNEKGKQFAAIAKVKLDGRADTSFADVGILTLPVGPESSEITHVIPQADGTINLVGIQQPGNRPLSATITKAGKTGNVYVM